MRVLVLVLLVLKTAGQSAVLKTYHDSHCEQPSDFADYTLPNAGCQPVTSQTSSNVSFYVALNFSPASSHATLCFFGAVDFACSSAAAAQCYDVSQAVCRAISLPKVGSCVVLYTLESNESTLEYLPVVMYILVPAAGVAVLSGAVFGVYYLRNRRKKRAAVARHGEQWTALMSASTTTIGGASNGDLVEFAALCQIKDVEVFERVSSGNFGVVYRGRWEGSVEVALKLLRDGVNTPEFVQDLNLLVSLRHPNVVQYLGTYAGRSNLLYLVMEFATKGSLRQLIYREGHMFSTIDLIEMMKHAASGMAYLHGRGVVHRHICLDKLLVTLNSHDEYIVKISDCLAYGGYEASGPRTAPHKWMAPESIAAGEYSEQSDVWSFGVAMWETFSWGAQPYADSTDAETVEAVQGGSRLPCPNGCPDVAYRLMSSCWVVDASQRPTFVSILQQLVDMPLNLQPELAGADPGRSKRTLSTRAQQTVAKLLRLGPGKKLIPISSQARYED
eukprot:TRINITY_DN9749_c0_g1_i1.p1 TRINITY_DN9749_c0_g1~~TRINITY_DN9749_c0_g1_i1.p1  ORF type:complete len:502 (-),score=129.68 TRINITY_DN9749_c0_g1_i1:216-1721(-)